MSECDMCCGQIANKSVLIQEFKSLQNLVKLKQIEINEVDIINTQLEIENERLKREINKLKRG